MTTNAFLKPAQLAEGGLALVRDPETMIPLAEGGEWKTMSQFWRRRLRDKEVIETAPPVAPAEVAASVLVKCAVCTDPEACTAAGACAHPHARRRHK